MITTENTLPIRDNKVSTKKPDTRVATTEMSSSTKSRAIGVAAPDLSPSIEKARAFEIQRYGQHAVAIREMVMKERGLGLATLAGRSQNVSVVQARQDVAYRAWTECRSLSLSAIASLIGRSDHSAATHAILVGARSRGICASKVSQLRDRGPDRIDWIKLAHRATGWREREGLTIEDAAQLAGIGRGEWRKAEQGQSIAAGTLLQVCRTIGAEPFGLLNVTHETRGKHAPRRAQDETGV